MRGERRDEGKEGREEGWEGEKERMHQRGGKL